MKALSIAFYGVIILAGCFAIGLPDGDMQRIASAFVGGSAIGFAISGILGWRHL